MKVNVEKTVILQDQEVEIAFVKDENGCVKFIDFVGRCCSECQEPHIIQRFVSVSEDVLQKMFEAEDDEHVCEDGIFNFGECVGCCQYDECMAKMLSNKHSD